jgi:hypothetical protein
MVTGSAAYLLQIVVFSPRPNALLRAACPDIIAFFQAEENVLELVHPGIGEEQRRIIVGNKAGTGDNGMPPVMEILKK